MRKAAIWGGVLGLAACGAPRGPEARSSHAEDAASFAPASSSPAAFAEPSLGIAPTPVMSPVPTTRPPDVDKMFAAHLAGHRDLTFADLERELALKSETDRALGFDPETVHYARLVMDKLAMTPEEKATFHREGVVNVDHDQRYGMGAAYFAIYTRDLPVLVTTDSVLHALHRSYDAILQQLEVTTFTQTVADTLQKSHDVLARTAESLRTPKLRDSAADVDVYLTVARNLLAGLARNGAPSVSSVLGNDARVRTILKKIASLGLEMPPTATEIYGGRRSIDYSQFKPRGHYTESPELSRYFQAVMWLGRADTGFVLAPPDPNSGIRSDDERELRSAALLAFVVRQGGTLDRFEAMRGIVDFLVGSSDNLTVPEMVKALDDAGLRSMTDLEAEGGVLALQKVVAELGKQQIRSQVIVPPSDAEAEAKVPDLFQLFGQRFLLDSYALSKVVYDSIRFNDRKMERQMPSGLDVMAVLGSDDATRLLRPELEKFQYSSNLLALRRTVDDLHPGDFGQSAYGLWLDALRTLDDVPKGNFPVAMRRTAFRRKQLQTALASWSELRHDTILYGKQSYSSGIACEYPEGYVEPYPELFARVARVADESSRRLTAMLGASNGYGAFLRNFGDTMRRLELLAKKELAAQPFTPEERGFLKKTVDQRGGGCGGPTWDGWYTRLFFNGGVETWKPTVSDVHTDPTSGTVLQEGVGDVNFFAVAVDNQKERAVYVGPVYSYYEFTHPASDRLTDEQWRAAIQNEALPPRPSWFTAAFPGKAVKRTPDGEVESTLRESEARAREIERIMRDISVVHDPAERQRLMDEIRKLRAPPPPKVRSGT